MAEPPSHPDERSARRALIEAARSLEPPGINQGSSGNVSLRWNRSARDGFLITPSGQPYAGLQAQDLCWMSFARPGHDPEQIVDALDRPSSEWRLHHDLLDRHCEVGAVVHTHPLCATALACLPNVQREGIPPFHYMIAVAGGPDIRCAPYATFGTQTLSDHVLRALEGRRACLMAHHGLVAMGETLEQALALAAEVEALAAVYLQTLQLGGPAVLSGEQMAEVLARFADYGPRARGG